MHKPYKNCPICKISKENCTCDEPFSLDAMPQHKLDGIAKAILVPIKEFYKDPVNQAKYEIWLKERKQKSKMAS